MKKLLIGFVRLICFAVDYFTNFIYRFLYEDDRRQIPPVSDVLLLDSASVLARKIRDKQVKSVEVMEAYIKRIKEINPVVNCIVDTRFEEALKEASEADRLVLEVDPKVLEREKPFLGVPFTTKDCMAVTGLSWTAGLLARKEKKAHFDADSVKTMREAGAIPIAVTNVSELCMWMESSNRVYGRTDNPYHTGRIVGGSSGGEGCAITSAASVFGIGSDVGGSIRMPAFYCGIFGHKPSTGVVSNYGQLPVAVGALNKILTTGPLCRYARDLMPMFKVLAGSKKSAELRLDQPVDIKKLKVYYMVDDGNANPVISPVHEEHKAAQMRVVQMLDQTHGMTCTKVQIRNFVEDMEIWSNMMTSEPLSRPFCQELREGQGEITPWWEFLKWICFKSSDHTLPAIGLAAFEKLIGTSHPDHAKFLKKCEDLRHELQLLLGDNGVLLYPSMPVPAPYHGQPMLRPFNFVYNGIFNALGNPSTQVPLGLGSLGVPLGIQVVGGILQDRNTLALALELEQLFGGWVPPTGVAS